MTKMLNRLSFLLLLLLQASCGSGKMEQSMVLEPLGAEILNDSQRTRDDKRLRQDSEAARRFLMAELSLGQEQQELALENFEASSRLLSSPDFQLQLNLAKLYISQGEGEDALSALAAFDSNAELLRLKAGILIALNKKEEGLNVYRTLLSLSKDDPEALIFLASQDLQLSQIEAAKEKSDKLLQLDARNLPALKLSALSAVAARNYSLALSQSKTYRGLDYGDEEIVKIMFLSALKTADYKLVTEELAREKKFRPDSQLVHLVQELGRELSSSEKMKEGLTFLESSIQLKPSFQQIRKEISRLKLLRQDFEGAVIDLGLLLLESPQDSELLYNLALALSSSGKSKAAIVELEKIKANSPLYVRAKSFAALLHKQAGDLEAAEQAFKNAIKKDPQSENLELALTLVLQERGKFSEAEAIFKKRLEKDPTNQSTLFSYAVLLHEMSKENESLELMQQLIKVNPQHAEALNFIAYSLAESEQELDRALDLVNRAIQIKPENSYFLDTRGWIYYKQKHFSLAREDLEKAAKLSNFDPEIAEHLGDLYLALGRKSEAIQTYRSALDTLIDLNTKSSQLGVERLKKKLVELE
jgi:tetratricopeptide (TPR) repeat protein